MVSNGYLGKGFGLIRKVFGNMATRAFGQQQTESGDELIDSDTGDARIGYLNREFATHPSKGLTPAKLYGILEDAEMGNIKAQHELFDDMEEKDPQIAADLGKRRQLAAELEWQIVPPEDATPQEQKATDFCAEVFSGLEVEDLIIDMGSGIGHGFSNLELTWSIDGGKRYIEQPTFRPHSWFRIFIDNQNELRLRDPGEPYGAPLWPLGWVQHRHKSKAGYVARSGLHRVLVWPYLFQSYALGDLAELLEIYGIPARVGTYPRNATDKEKATLLRAVVSLGHRAAGIIPEGMQIDFKDAADGKADLFLAMMEWCDRAKTKAVLGGTLTSSTGNGTNTNALGNVHERGQQSLIRSDVRQYAGTINRDILWPMAMINFGIEDRKRAPRFMLDTAEAEDYKLLAESLPVFVDMGAKIPTWWLHEKTRIPEATGKDDVLKPIAVKKQGTLPTATPDTPPAPDASTTAARANTDTGDNPQPDTLIADQLGDKAQPVIADWLGKISAMLDAASSLDEFRGMLINAFSDLPEDELASLMSQAMLSAESAGRFDVEHTGG